MCARIRVPFGFAPGGGTFLTPRSIRRKHLMQRARGASPPGDAGSARHSHAPREQCKKSLIGACGRHAPPRTWTPALRNRQRGPMTKTPIDTNPATRLSWWQLVLICFHKTIGVFTNTSRSPVHKSSIRPKWMKIKQTNHSRTPNLEHFERREFPRFVNPRFVKLP